MKYLLLVLLFCCQSIIAQTTSTQLKTVAQKFISENKFEDARNIYKMIIKKGGRWNKDNWFDLASIEMHLNEKDSACAHYYKAYKLKDKEAERIMREKLPDCLNEQIKADELEAERNKEITKNQPKFIYDGKEYEMCNGRKLSNKYIEVYRKLILESKIIDKARNRGTLESLRVSIHINSEGIFDGKIIKMSPENIKDKDKQEIQQEIMNVFGNTIKYIPAKHDGGPVDSESWNIGFNF